VHGATGAAEVNFPSKLDLRASVATRVAKRERAMRDMTAVCRRSYGSACCDCDSSRESRRNSAIAAAA
jgi:hypothetical protein